MDENLRVELSLSSESTSAVKTLRRRALRRLADFNKKHPGGVSALEEKFKLGPGLLDSEQTATLEAGRELNAAQVALGFIGSEKPVTPMEIESALKFVGQEVTRSRNQWVVDDLMNPGENAQKYLELLNLEKELVEKAVKAFERESGSLA